MDKTMNRRPYVREVPRVTWFLRGPRYVRYMLREVTCLFVGGYMALLVVALARLAEGAAAWEGFLQALRSPASVVFHVAALVFSVYHSVTWFNLTPKALPVQVGESFVPGGVIAGAHYAAWAVLSLAVLAAAGAF